MTIQDLVFVRNPAVTETKLDDDVFLVEPESGDVFYLNTITGGLWTLFAEPATQADALTTFRAAFPDQPEDEVIRDVAAFLVSQGFEEVGRYNMARTGEGAPIQADFLFRRCGQTG